jgi:hypothetical protein
MNGLQKFFTKDRIIIMGLFILIAIFMVYYSTGKSTIMDSMDGGPAPVSMMGPSPPPPPSNCQLANPPVSSGYSNHSVANPADLLPNDANSKWASLNPVSQNNPQLPDMLQAGYHIGLDTIGQTMKNANLQLRSDPIISKVDVGPWNQSTLEPDLMRVPLEVGEHRNGN